MSVCFVGSACIELAQQRYFPSRVPSFADVQHNGLGGLFGALLAWPFAVSWWGGRDIESQKQPMVAQRRPMG